jgi:N-glycosylase/DNA lyase
LTHLLFTATLANIGLIDLEATLFCGQAFRWHKISDGVFSGVVRGVWVELSQPSPAMICIRSTHESIADRSLVDFFFEYLGLADLIESFANVPFARKYPKLYRETLQYAGIRIMRQDPFELLISFMCAQGMGIRIIRRQIQLLSEKFGEAHDGYFSFPTATALAAASLETMTACTNNNKIRAANIIQVARNVASGKLNVEQLVKGHAVFDDARTMLIKQRGIGEKIADCVCLFGLGHLEAFPIDTHVRQYLETWFHIKPETKSLTPEAYALLCTKARKLFGDSSAGYWGQVLFHYWRVEVRGLPVS